jgi:hypothetical protein
VAAKKSRGSVGDVNAAVVVHEVAVPVSRVSAPFFARKWDAAATERACCTI